MADKLNFKMAATTIYLGFCQKRENVFGTLVLVSTSNFVPMHAIATEL